MSRPTHGVWCIRAASSRLGAAASWLKRGQQEGGGRWEGTKEEAETRAAHLRVEMRSPNLNYLPKELTDGDD